MQRPIEEGRREMAQEKTQKEYPPSSLQRKEEEERDLKRTSPPISVSQMICGLKSGRRCQRTLGVAGELGQMPGYMDGCEGSWGEEVYRELTIQLLSPRRGLLKENPHGAVG
ncbi:hypothetical protein NDU88_005909 [Pleurodeles waltl]|uniref:Uncharacterized protein n=1 Tax=Pleurodeles waltl TaxID=8319 RepID=A0AAV7SN11_PLEWA|nr:hypothetical protein NDU88_005909 [Pleurodeles waltl]